MDYLQENVYVPSETLESVQKVLLPQYEKAKEEIKVRIKESLKEISSDRFGKSLKINLM
tara:strand:+ start:1165 stop:1341 length:177 start_codon:yes stop_codon:yes gene_type:complete